MTLALAREIWLSCGRKRCPVSQSRDQWNGDFPLPDIVAEYYETVGPDELYCFDETHLTLYLPSLSQLAEFQIGILETAAIPGREDRDSARPWGPDRLAVAIHHTYPCILDVASGAVAFCVPGATQGAGWQTVSTLESLAQMMIFFGVLEEAIEDVPMFDDNGEQSADFLPHLIDQASARIDRVVATSILNVMYG